VPGVLPALGLDHFCNGCACSLLGFFSRSDGFVCRISCHSGLVSQCLMFPSSTVPATSSNIAGFDVGRVRGPDFGLVVITIFPSAGPILFLRPVVEHRAIAAPVVVAA
jgi:hypothetical protein